MSIFMPSSFTLLWESGALVREALLVASVWHEGQNARPCADSSTSGGDLPFISHPLRVALATRTLFGCADEDVTAAALLHDTLEKTDLPRDEIFTRFGERVGEMVVDLSKLDGMGEDAYWEHLAKASWRSRLIKMADALDHLDCVAEDMPERIHKAELAIGLAFSNEAPVRRAKGVLEKAVAMAERGEAVVVAG